MEPNSPTEWLSCGLCMTGLVECLSSNRETLRRETKADTLKATEANRKRGPGTREKVRSKRINLEGKPMHRKSM
jgi:hypothetical protein